MSEVSPYSARRRINVVDAAKGIGIVLVVLGHSLGGIIDSKLDTHGMILRYSFLFIYTFHMPLFFLLSGIFVQRRIAEGARTFTVSVIRRVLYPYLLWSFLQIGIICLANTLVNKPISNPAYFLMNVWWLPVSQFWYLQTLAFCHLLIVISLRMSGMRFALLMSIVGLVLSTYYSLASPIRILAHFFPYYLVGAYLGASGFRKALALARSPTIFFPLLAAALTVSLTTTWVLAHTVWRAFNAEPNRLHASDIAKLGWAANPITQLLAIFALLTLCLHMPKGVSKVAEALGTYSFPIYILHVFCVAGVRIALDKGLHVNSIAIIMLASVAAGLIFPVVLFKWVKARHLDRMLGLG